MEEVNKTWQALKSPVRRDCFTCKYEDYHPFSSMCKTCICKSINGVYEYSNWERKNIIEREQVSNLENKNV